MHNRIYADYASATPISRSVRSVMRKHSANTFGNPSAPHAEGVAAREVLENARKNIAQYLSVQAREIVFTSGGTESNTLACIGYIEALAQDGRAYQDMHVITSTIEHSTILNACAALERRGVRVTYVSPDAEGIIQPRSIQKALTPQTVFVSIQYVNSEIGTIMPLRAIAREIRKAHPTVAFHTDAAQAPLFCSLQLQSLGVDMLSLDGQKMCGPRGSGVFVVKSHIIIAPILFGGAQEDGRRPGTENVVFAAGIAQAFSEAQEKRDTRSAHIKDLRDELTEALVGLGAIVNGSREHRVANNVNVSFPGVDTEYLMMLLDADGIAVSTKSACEGTTGTRSSVVYALGQDEARARATLRITLGPDISKRDIKRIVRSCKKHLDFLTHTTIEG